MVQSSLPQAEEPIGQIMVSEGHITEDDLYSLLDKQENNRLGQLAVNNGYCLEDEFYECLARRYDPTQYVNNLIDKIHYREIDNSLRNPVIFSACLKLKILPTQDGVVLSDPENQAAVRYAYTQYNEPEIKLASAGDVAEALRVLSNHWGMSVDTLLSLHTL